MDSQDTLVIVTLNGDERDKKKYHSWIPLPITWV